MSSPTLTANSNATNKPRKSMLPLPQPILSHKPTPLCPPDETPRKLNYKQTEPKTPKQNSNVVLKKRPLSATPSLTFPRSVSASNLDTRPRIRPKQQVLSYNNLSQENHKLQGELSSLRSLLQQVEFEKAEQFASSHSEITKLSLGLEEATSNVTSLSNDVKTQQDQITELLSVLEGKGIDPLSGEVIITKDQRMQDSIAAVEKTKIVSESLQIQNSKFTNMLDDLRDKRLQMSSLLTKDQQETLEDKFRIIDNTFSDTEYGSNYTSHVIAEEPLTT
ncbi:hypothetical protein LOD99_12845 [Oopsacas minuta]|uniref:Uncharacterized protein n=1 Tax=Oopsacas minuta TaxID=111878 RepID=A0AAV7JD64_9METZ|nr:hypothetical protein LOD99_12845 [Oopsacas minuta]